VSAWDENARARREARASWPIVQHQLGEEPSDDLSDVTTASERVAMMRSLAETAWRVAGRPLPTYARHEIPGRLFRPGEPRPDDDDT
jgi:hypothetical protein